MKKIILIIAVLSLAAVSPLRADDMAGAKKIFAEKQDSVIWITGVAKVSFTTLDSSSGANIPDEEAKVMAMGTIVSTNGLVVTVLSQLDPSSNVKGQMIRTENGPVKLDATSVIKELKAVMPDGTEVPAELVLKDVNLDLAVVRIKSDSKEASGEVFHAVDLKDSAEGHILDEVATIIRMPEVFYRVPAITTGRIGMITKKPRVFLRAEGSAPGCPTFNLDGKLIGITAGRTMGGRVVEAAIIPATDVLDVVEQSKKEKPVADKVKTEAGKPAPEKSDKPAAMDKKN
jgi:S1-C subfamily serine protease